MIRLAIYFYSTLQDIQTSFAIEFIANVYLRGMGGFDFNHIKGTVNGDGRLVPGDFSGDEFEIGSVMAPTRQQLGGCVVEIWCDVFVLGRKCNPDLEAVHVFGGVAEFIGGALGMNDATAGGHEVDGTGVNLDVCADGIAVKDSALDEVSEGGEANVRMREDVEILVLGECDWAHVIDINEGANHPFLAKREQTANEECTDLGGAFFDDEIDGGHKE